MKKNIGGDLKTLLNESYLTDMAESHIDCWKDRYFRKSKKDIRFDLVVNHDNSLEIERAEEDLKRELTDDERNYLNRKFIQQVVKVIY